MNNILIYKFIVLKESNWFIGLKDSFYIYVGVYLMNRIKCVNVLSDF